MVRDVEPPPRTEQDQSSIPDVAMDPALQQFVQTLDETERAGSVH